MSQILEATQETALKVTHNIGNSTGTLPSISCGKYCYQFTPDDLQREQQVFHAGDGVSIYTQVCMYVLQVSVHH